jgi:hypothetical protein
VQAKGRATHSAPCWWEQRSHWGVGDGREAEAGPALEGLKFTYRVTWSLCAVLRDWIGDGIGCAGWYREGQCWVVYSVYECTSGRIVSNNSRLLELMSRGTAAGVTYTTTVLLLPASLRRIAWRGGGCPIVRPQIVTVERSHMHELLSFSPAWRRAWAAGGYQYHYSGCDICLFLPDIVLSRLLIHFLICPR